VLLVGLAIVTSLLFPVAPLPDLPTCEAGEIASEDVIATVDFTVYKSGADLAREQAEAAAVGAPTFRDEPAGTDSMSARIEEFIARIDSAAADACRTRSERAVWRHCCRRTRSRRATTSSRCSRPMTRDARSGCRCATRSGPLRTFSAHGLEHQRSCDPGGTAPHDAPCRRTNGSTRSVFPGASGRSLHQCFGGT
jgi:hypothetical protein